MKEDKFQRTKVIPELSKYDFLKVSFVMNETGKDSKKLGAWKKAMGILPGASDLIVYDLKHMKIDYIELKGYELGKTKKYIKMGEQSEKQAEFEDMVNMFGCDYYLIRNPDELQAYIDIKLDKNV